MVVQCMTAIPPGAKSPWPLPCRAGTRGWRRPDGASTGGSVRRFSLVSLALRRASSRRRTCATPHADGLSESADFARGIALQPSRHKINIRRALTFGKSTECLWIRGRHQRCMACNALASLCVTRGEPWDTSPFGAVFAPIDRLLARHAIQRTRCGTFAATAARSPMCSAPSASSSSAMVTGPNGCIYTPRRSPRSCRISRHWASTDSSSGSTSLLVSSAICSVPTTTATCRFTAFRWHPIPQALRRRQSGWVCYR